MAQRPKKLLDQVRACPEYRYRTVVHPRHSIWKKVQGLRENCSFRPDAIRCIWHEGAGAETPARWFLISCSRSPFQPRVLLLDHTLVQLLEERRRLAQRLAVRQGAWRPRPHRTAMIVG
jgi:chorismate mutase